MYACVLVCVCVCVCIMQERACAHVPPKDGIIALSSATNRWYVVKNDSQKRNQSKKSNQWYNILVTFIGKFNCRRYENKI